MLGSTIAPGQGQDGMAADVVLLEPGCFVAAGWLDGLADAAASAGAVATVSALTQHDVELRSGLSFDDAAEAARTRSLRLRPRLATAHGPCVHVSRSALELIGESDADGLARAELSRRCTESGLLHVLADDVLVLDRRPGPAKPIATGGNRGPEARAVGKVRRAIAGLSAVIDARILYGSTTGTHVHVLEVVAGLARTEKVRLTVIVPDDPSELRRPAVGVPARRVARHLSGGLERQGRAPTSSIGLSS